MSSKKTTTTNQTQNTAQTSTPNVPSWIQTPTMNAASQVGALQAQGAGAYTPGVSDLQTQAAQAASGLSTSGYYGQAGGVLNNLGQVTNGGSIANIDNGGGYSDITNGGTIDPLTGQSVLTNLSSYYNPFQSQVMDPVLAQYDQQAGMTRAAQAAQAAQGGAFGGSRYGVQEAQTEGQLAMGRASTQGGLLNQMYTQAAGMSEADTARRQAADMANQQGQEFTAGQNLTASQANQQAQLNQAARQLQAEQANQQAQIGTAGRTMSAEQANQAAQLQQAGLLTGLGTAQDTSNRANVSLQDQVGAQMTDLQNAIKQYPMQYQAQIESLLSGLNPALYTGQSSTGTGQSQGTSTETSNPGAMGILGGLVQAGSMFAPGLGGVSAAGNIFNSFRQGIPPT